MNKIIYLSVVTVLLSACSGPGKRTDQPAPIVDRTQSTENANTQQGIEIRGYENSEQFEMTPMHIPAVESLLKKAKSQQMAGNVSAAVGSLERAVRLSPKDAWLWHELAQMTLASGNSAQAIQQAKKSSSLAGADRALKDANMRLINRSR